MRILSVMNQKGGCGKTTTAVNLAGALQAKGHRVLVVDMDPQAHATMALNGRLGAPIQRTLHDPLLRRHGLDPILVSPGPRLDLAPSGDDLLFAERDLGSGEAGEERLKECLRLSRLDHEFVLIDCPPSLGPLTLNALRACDEIVVPMEIGFFSLNGVSGFLRALGRYRRDWLTEKRIRALATLVDPRTTFAREVMAEMRRFFGPALYRTVIHQNVRLKEAASFGLPITEYDRRCRGCADHMALAEEVLADGPVHADEEPAAVAQPASR
jgi:chromosome partitioning protein